MPSVRITRTPAGEAPEHIREAWVGLTLPLPSDRSGKRQVFPVFGVLSGPKSIGRTFWSLLTGKHIRYDGYAVATLTALEVLEARSPAAASWWRANTPHLLKPQSRLIFEAEVCEEIP
jgi:hypothetical protein